MALLKRILAMKGEIKRRRYSKEDLKQIEAMIEQDLTNSEIAEKLGRTQSAIRNLRHRKSLIKRTEDEIKILRQQRDQLRDEVKTLREQHQTVTHDIESLTRQVESLRLEKQKLERNIAMDKIALQQTLAQALRVLKQQRPELFVLSQEELNVFLVRMFLRR